MVGPRIVVPYEHDALDLNDITSVVTTRLRLLRYRGHWMYRSGPIELTPSGGCHGGLDHYGEIPHETQLRTATVGAWIGFLAGALVGVIIDVVLSEGIFVAIIGHTLAVVGAIVGLHRFRTSAEA